MIYKNLHLIVAVTEKTNAIGIDNDMIYFVKEDMDFFKEKTIGNTIICGRKTFESFNIKPLPKRKNIVLTRGDFKFDGVETYHSLEELLDYIEKNPNETFLVSGGATIYKKMIDYCSKLYITKYEEKEEVKADAHFPEIEDDKWEITEKREGKNQNPKLTFYTYERKK